MSVDQIINLIHKKPEIYFKKAKTSGYVCPLCKNGLGEDGTGIILNNDYHYKCFKCGFYGDVIDFIAKSQGITDGRSNEAFMAACAIYKDEIERSIKNMEQNKIINTTEIIKPNIDYSEYFIKKNKQLYMTDYHNLRGISNNTAQRFLLGFDEIWRSPTAVAKGYKIQPSPRLIIPTSRYSYIARDIRPENEIFQKERKYLKMKEGKVVTFNKKALWNSDKPIFLVEGEIDALSIIEAGGEAVALGSACRINAFINEIKVKKPLQPLLIAMDNDEIGKNAEKIITTQLPLLNIPFSIVNITGNLRDANEALIKDRLIFIKIIKALENCCYK